MTKFYFIDESGNSGDIATNNARSGFAGQPFFSLACIGVDEKESINNFANDLFTKYNIQARELKSKNIIKSGKMRAIIPEVIDFLIHNKCNVLIELVNKKYQLCSQIVEYYIVCPYLECSIVGYWLKYSRRRICDLLYNKIDDDQLNKISNGFCSQDNDVSCIDVIFDVVFDIVSHFPLFSFVLKKRICKVKELFNKVKSEKGHKEAKKRFLPLPDYSGEKKYGMLPSVSSLANLYGRINRIEDDLSSVIIIHDEQNEFNIPLSTIMDTTPNISPELCPVTSFADFNFKEEATFQFESSLNEYGIQLADILAGTFMRLALYSYNSSEMHPEFIEAYRKIESCAPSMNIGINYVLPTEEYEKIGELLK